MNSAIFVLCAILIAALVSGRPQREVAAYTNEVIRQAQQTFLIPKDAQIQNVQEGIELGAYEQIPGNQRINLFEILGDQVLSEVINNLQGQVEIHEGTDKEKTQQNKNQENNKNICKGKAF